MDGDAAGFVELNRDLWDKRVRAHLAAAVYPSQGVEDGSYRVSEPDVAEVGDVAGRRLLHLQSNAGADTLYWARHGAEVVGVDFSREAVAEARRLAAATGLPAEFVCSDIYDLTDHRLGRFDIVYTSMGVLWWLPDLDRWAELIAAHLTAGGFFYIHEIHPFAMTLRDGDGGELVAGEDYFGSPEPVVFESSGTYYETSSEFRAETGTECGWIHSLGDVVTALSRAGLWIEHLHEYPFTHYRMLPSLVQDDQGRWTRPAGRARLPLTFYIRARHR